VAVNPVVCRLLASTVCPGVAIRLRQEAGSGVVLPWGEWEPPSQEVLVKVRATIANLLAKLVGERRLMQCWQPFLLTLCGVYAPLELLPGAAGLQAAEDASIALTAAMDAGGGAVRYEHKLCDEAAAGSACSSLSYAECEIPDADAAARMAVNAAACAATGTAGGDRMLLTPLACFAEYQASAPSPAEPGVASDEPAVGSDEPDAAADTVPFDVASCLRQIMELADVLPETASNWIRELAALPSLSAAAEAAEVEAEEGDADAANEEDDDLEEEDKGFEDSE